MNVHSILVDNWCLVDILAYETYKKMGLLDKAISPHEMSSTDERLYV